MFSIMYNDTFFFYFACELCVITVYDYVFLHIFLLVSKPAV